MPSIPNNINGVRVEFASLVNTTVNQKLIEGLKEIITPSIAAGYTLSNIYVSSANDQHAIPSRHAIGKGVDISRINGMKLSLFYCCNSEVSTIVDAIQEKFEKYLNRRENFGPLFQKKLGHTFPVSGHRDHIHLSVN